MSPTRRPGPRRLHHAPSYVQDIDDNISADDKKLFWIERKDLLALAGIHRHAK